MTLRLPSFVLVRIAALLLATIGFQATVPIATAERAHGSAFSAQTYEVALAPREDVRGAPLSTDPFPPEPRTFAVPGPAASMRKSAAPRPWSTGPPRPGPSVRLPQPRAPPLA